MSISVIREQQVKFNEHGQSVLSDETYVKIAVSFMPILKQFKGARLSAFLALALNESEMSLGQSTGLSIYDIAAKTDYKPRQILTVMQHLCENNFATKLDERGEHGEFLYRVSAYAWFGNPHATTAASNGGYAKNAHHPKNATNCIGMQKKTPVVVGTDVPVLNENKIQQQTEVRDFLQTMKIAEPSLTRLSQTVELECAQRWSEWLAHPSKGIKQPRAFMISQLRADPKAEPPEDEINQARQGSWYEDYNELVKR